MAAHAPSNNDAARTKTAEEEAIPIADNSDIFSAVDIFELPGKKSIDKFSWCVTGVSTPPAGLRLLQDLPRFPSTAVSVRDSAGTEQTQRDCRRR